MPEEVTLPTTPFDRSERIAAAVREALPGEAGEILLARIAAELADFDADDGQAALGELGLELERTMSTDQVTGLPNRLRFMDDLTRGVAAATRYSEPLSLLLLDLTGDDADERSAGEALLRLIRVTDFVARIAPGRFAILLPRTNASGRNLVATRVQSIEGHTFVIGGVTLDGETIDAPVLLARAEESLEAQSS